MGHRVTLYPAGRGFEARADERLLEAALRQAVALPYGCRSGGCGVCRARVLAGEVTYPEGPPLGLTDAERAAGYALLCLAHAASDLVLEAHELAGVAELVVKTLPARVARMAKLSPDVMGLWLKLPAVERLQFLAGQYLDILLPDGRRRSFSIANAPHEDALIELHVRHVPGGSFTTRVFEEIHEKSLLRIQGPLGTFFLREDSPRPAILIGGGTGFAPLKSMLSHAFHLGITRPLRLYWGARTARDLYLRDVPERWARERPNFTFVPVLSEPEADWRGRHGFVHRAVLEDHPDLSGFDVYMAGPPAMIEAARYDFAQAGLPSEQLFYDAFEYGPDVLARLRAIQT